MSKKYNDDYSAYLCEKRDGKECVIDNLKKQKASNFVKDKICGGLYSRWGLI